MNPTTEHMDGAEMTHELDKAKAQLAMIRAYLSPFIIGADPASMTEAELAEYAATAIRDGMERIFSRNSDDMEAA